MIDYILKFPSEQKSVEMAFSAGLIQQDETTGESKLVRFTNDYGIFVQGVISGREGWWVRVRILTDRPIPKSFEPFITTERPVGLWNIA